MQGVHSKHGMLCLCVVVQLVAGCCRYTSYGRHFTKLPLLKQVAQMLSFYLHDGDTVVDFSCGANAFVPLVKQEGAKQGLTISGCSFDIITSQNLEDFQRCSWMDVHPGTLLLGSCSECFTRLLGHRSYIACAAKTNIFFLRHRLGDPMIIFMSHAPVKALLRKCK